MARRKNPQTIEENPVSDTDFDVDFDATDEVVVEETTSEEKPAKTKKVKEKSKGDLPEGYVTPIGLTAAINEQGLAFDKQGNVKQLKPQEMYSYLKNAPKDRPSPFGEVEDSLGKTRNAARLEDGLAWWNAKNEAASARKASAAEKAAAKAERKAKKGESAETTVDVDESVEEFVDA